MALSSVLHTQNPAPLQLNAVGAVGAGGTTCRALLCATSPYKSKCQQADPSVVVGRRRGRHRWRVHPTEAPLFLAPVPQTWHTHTPTHPHTPIEFRWEAGRRQCRPWFQVQDHFDWCREWSLSYIFNIRRHRCPRFVHLWGCVDTRVDRGV